VKVVSFGKFADRLSTFSAQFYWQILVGSRSLASVKVSSNKQFQYSLRIWSAPLLEPNLSLRQRHRLGRYGKTGWWQRKREQHPTIASSGRREVRRLFGKFIGGAAYANR